MVRQFSNSSIAKQSIQTNATLQAFHVNILRLEVSCQTIPTNELMFLTKNETEQKKKKEIVCICIVFYQVQSL